MKVKITLLLLLLASSLGASALTPAQVLEKSSAALLKAGGVTATFTMQSGGQSVSGSFKAKGQKFVIEGGGITSWYDGKTQWDYNARHDECTISTPTPQEVATTSPYALVKNYKSLFTLKPLKSKIAGTYAVALHPRRKGTVRSATIYIRASDFMPVRLDVTSSDGVVSVLAISGVKTGAKLADSQFTFPRSRYPKAEIIDLR